MQKQGKQIYTIECIYEGEKTLTEVLLDLFLRQGMAEMDGEKDICQRQKEREAR